MNDERARPANRRLRRDVQSRPAWPARALCAFTSYFDILRFHVRETAALPGPKARKLPGNLTEMMQVIVNDFVVVVDVFGTESITDQQNPCFAQMSESRIDDAITLSVQIETHARAA